MSKVNRLWPGKPNYSGPAKGYFTFLHHDTPIEFSPDVRERIRYIKWRKPPNEVATRLHAIKYIGANHPSFLCRILHRKLKKIIPKVKWRTGRRGGLVFPKQKGEFI